MTRKNNLRRGPRLGAVGERGLLDWILPRLQSRNRGQFLVPAGDDAAVLSSIGRPVLSIDGLSEGTHFKLSWEPLLRRSGFTLGRALGWKLLGSSLSDLASMGDVKNRWAMIFVGAPPEIKTSFLKDFFIGLQEIADQHHCLLVGGDTVRAQSLTLVAAVGGTLASRPMTRKGARPGDIIGIVGTVGDADLGLKVLEKKQSLTTSDARYFIRRFFDSTPMFAEGRLLAKTKGVTSLMDLSDPLTESLDLLLPPPSDLGFGVDLNSIPRSSRFKKSVGLRPEWISPGEDYSLLFTVSPRAADRLFRRPEFRPVGWVARHSEGRKYFLNNGLFHPRPSFEHFR